MATPLFFYQKKMNYPLVLFDGVCNLCNRAVDFILKRDPKKRFRFVAIQSEAGQFLMGRFNVPAETDSVILIVGGSVYTQSEAALEIARLLPFPWRMAVVLKIIPENIRNRMYRWIAKNRYKWFGKKKTCRIPTEQEQKVFPGLNELKV